MKTRIVVAFAGLLVAVASPASAGPLPKCPGVTTAGDWVYPPLGPCRLGQFTLDLFNFDNEHGIVENGWIDQVSMGIFGNHIDFTFHANQSQIDYTLDPTAYQGTPLDWFFERFRVNVSADDGTMFVGSGLSSPGSVTFDVPTAGQASVNVWGGRGPGDYWGFGSIGTGCTYTGSTNGPVTCPIGTSFVPEAPTSSVFFQTGWFVAVSATPGSTDPLSVSMVQPSWTASLYFVTPVSITPEPSTWVLMATGLTLVGIIAWRRRIRA